MDNDNDNVSKNTGISTARASRFFDLFSTFVWRSLHDFPVRRFAKDVNIYF